MAVNRPDRIAKFFRMDSFDAIHHRRSLSLLSGDIVHYFNLNGDEAHRHAGLLPLHSTAAGAAIAAREPLIEDDTSPSR